MRRDDSSSTLRSPPRRRLGIDRSRTARHERAHASLIARLDTDRLLDARAQRRQYLLDVSVVADTLRVRRRLDHHRRHVQPSGRGTVGEQRAGPARHRRTPAWPGSVAASPRPATGRRAPQRHLCEGNHSLRFARHVSTGREGGHATPATLLPSNGRVRWSGVPTITTSSAGGPGAPPPTCRHTAGQGVAGRCSGGCAGAVPRRGRRRRAIMSSHRSGRHVVVDHGVSRGTLQRFIGERSDAASRPPRVSRCSSAIVARSRVGGRASKTRRLGDDQRDPPARRSARRSTGRHDQGRQRRRACHHRTVRRTRRGARGLASSRPRRWMQDHRIVSPRAVTCRATVPRSMGTSVP